MSFKTSKYASSFSPQNIPGLALWLDAADYSSFTFSSGSNISQWNDKSGNGRNAVGNIGTGTYSTTGLNSRPTVQITSSGNMISSVPAGTFSNGIALFVVFQKTGANNTIDTIVARTVTNVPAPFDFYTRSVDGFTRTHRLVGNVSNTGANEEDITGVARRTSPTIWSVTVYSTSPTTWLEYLNGTPTTYTITGGNSYGDVATTFQIGTRADNFTKMNGNISEIIAYNVSSFSTSQQQQVESYLAWKWGLVGNLPAAHPYRTAPIFTRPFNPLDVSGCTFWIDAADARTVTTTNGLVTALLDKSGSNVTLSNVAGFSYPNNTFNGRYPSFLNGNQDSSTKLGENSSFTISQPITTFFVGKKNPSRNWYDGYIFDGTSSRIAIYGAAYSMFAGGGISVAQTESNVVHCGIFNPAGSFNFINGALGSGGSGVSVGTNTLSGLRIGNSVGNADPWMGHYCEFLIYNRALSSNDRQQVENYLAEKWGLQSSLSTSNALRLFRALSPVFNPTLLSNCTLWLDAGDAGTMSFTGSNLTTWRDKSGVGNNGTATGTITNTGSINGTSVLQWTGATFKCVSGTLSNTTTTLSTFAVFNMSSSSADFSRILGFTIGTEADWTSVAKLAAIFKLSGTPTGYGSYRGSSAASSNITSAFNVPIIASILFDGTNNILYVNGVAGVSSTNGSGGAFGYNTYVIGGELGTPTVFTEASIAEVIHYPNFLPTQQRQRIEGYLAKKWNIALPTTHPYYSTPV